MLARPAAPIIDVDNLTQELYVGTVRKIDYKNHTTITGSAGTYHLSPNENYYKDGSDYRAWPNEVSARVYDDRTVTGGLSSIDVYGQEFREEFYLFDSLIEQGSGGVTPVRVTGPSSTTAPYMRSDGSKLIRYPELPIINNALILTATQNGQDTFYFSCPAFAEPEVMQTQLCSIEELGDDNPAFSGALKYIQANTAEYEDVISNLSNSVDGTGTLLSTIYRRHSGLLMIQQGTNVSLALDYLVGLYNKIVVAKFYGPGNDGNLEVVLETDEFLMESLLPRQGSTFTLPDIGCIPHPWLRYLSVLIDGNNPSTS